MTREAIQSFIDGYLKAGGNPESIRSAVIDWMDSHPVYPQAKLTQEVIASDIESYRGVVAAPAIDPAIEAIP